MGFPSTVGGVAKNGGNLLKGTPPPTFVAPPSSLAGKFGGAAAAVIFELLFPPGTVSEQDEQRAIRNAELATEQGGQQEVQESPPPPFEGGQIAGGQYICNCNWHDRSTNEAFGVGGQVLPGPIQAIECFVTSKDPWNDNYWAKITYTNEGGEAEVLQIPYTRPKVHDIDPAYWITVEPYGDTPQGGGNPPVEGGIDSAIPPSLLGDAINSLPPGTKFAGLNDSTAFPPRGNIFNPPKPAENKPPPIVNNNITNNNYYNAFPPDRVINNNPAENIGGNNNNNEIGGQEFFIPTVVGGDIISLDTPSKNASSNTDTETKSNQSSAPKKAYIDTTKKNPTIEDLLRDGKKISSYPDSFLKHIDKYRSNKNASLTNSEILKIINQKDYKNSDITLGDISNGAIRTENEIVFEDVIQTNTKTDTDVNADVKSSDIELIAAAVAAVMFNSSNTQKLENAAAAGTCQTTQQGGCMQQNILNPLQQGQANLSNLFNNIGITGLATQNAAIQAIAQNTNDIVKNGTYGLEAIQNFAQKAWSFTKTEKVLQVINTALLIHNASMLSQNIAVTLGEVINNALATIGVKDAEGNSLDINEAIGKTVTNLITSIIGAENYQQLTLNWAKASRIYQTGVNVLSNLREIIDLGQDITETVGENVSVIGNALKKSGVVRENSYPWMPENLNTESRWQNRLEKLEDTVDIFEDITDSTRNIKEELDDMQENSKAFKEELDKAKESKLKKETENKNTATRTAVPQESDEYRFIESDDEN